MPKHSTNTTSTSQTMSNGRGGPTTLSTFRLEADLWYRLQVLLYDLSSVTSDPQSERRLSSTTHPLYISPPYLTEAQAANLREATIEKPESDSGIDEKKAGTQGSRRSVEEAAYAMLNGFLDKRKASGDSRPCGPHDMLPAYLQIFGIRKEELKDEKFLSRLRRAGLDDTAPAGAPGGGSQKVLQSSGKKSGGHGNKERKKGRR